MSTNMSLSKILNELGLKGNKAIVYLAVLSLGAGTAADVAKSAKLPRTTTHEILQSLLTIGLVSFMTKVRSRVYIAEKPSVLLRILQEKERKLERILPELNSMYSKSGQAPKVRFYEGIEGVKNVLEDTLQTSNKLLMGILSMEDLFATPGKEYMSGYVKKRVSIGIKLKVIRSESKEVSNTWPYSNTELREVHYAPASMVFPLTTYIYDKKVALIGTAKENFGMIIESDDYYSTQKNLFDTLWQVTRVAKKVN